tara:strand:- start:161 stop:340 length:180 start_codon:yes stop_codon:yes gene_type:complete
VVVLLECIIIHPIPPKLQLKLLLGVVVLLMDLVLLDLLAQEMESFHLRVVFIIKIILML